MTTPLTTGSMCTGYGGLDLAVSTVLGARPAWVADPDPGAAAILAHRYPRVPNLGDITAVDWAAVPPVDVLTAGFPCQDLSYAGRGAGIKEGTRSGLWFTVARAVGVLRPRLIVLENVAAIVARRPGLDVVAADLAALGFDAEWTCVRASDVGAPHRRERWFCLAWPADTESPRLEIGRQRRPASSPAADPADLGHERCRPARDGRAGPTNRRLAPADAHGLSSSDDRELSARRDAVQRRIRDDTAGRRPAAVADADQGRQRAHEPNLRARQPDVDWGTYTPAVRRWEHLTGRRAPRPTEPGRSGERLSPAFVEWLMGLPPGWVTGVPGLTRNQQLHALGNGVVPAQAEAALIALLPAYLAPA